MDVAPVVSAPQPGLLHRARKMGHAAWKIALILALLLPAAVVTAVVLREAPRRSVEVAAISVPVTLAGTGFSGEVVAFRLLDAVEATARAVHDERDGRPAAEFRGALPDFIGPAAGLSPRGFAGPVRNLLGWPERRLSGEVVTTGDTLRLRLRLSGHGVIAEVSGPATAGADALLASAAPEVWRVVSPRLYAWHLATLDAPGDDIRDRLTALRRLAPDEATQATITTLIARSLTRSGRPAEALEMLDALSAVRPADAAAQYGRAEALRALGRTPEALEAQRRSLALDPDNAWGYLVAAALLRDLGRLEESLAAARRAQDLDADDRPGLVEEARTLRAMARMDGAAAAARRAVALDPRYAPALAELGQVMLQGRDHAAALELFERVLTLASRMATAGAGRGEAVAALDRVQEALEALARAIALDEADQRPQGLRGEVLHGLHQWAEALETFDAALALAPERAALHLGRGIAALRLNRPTVALEALRRAQSLGLDDDTSRALIAEAEAMMQ